MKPAIPVLSLVLLLVASPLLAQEITAPRFGAAEPATPALLDLPPLEAAPADRGSRATEAPAAEAPGFSFRPILHAIGGAVVGGWVGYVGAQVVKSDWDKSENGSFSGQRTTWVAAGAAVGMLGSWLIGGTRSPAGPFTPQRPSARDRSLITGAEIRETGLQNALEVVTALRRDWLQTRGTNSWDESTRGSMSGFGDSFEASVVPGRDKIIVYMDDIRIGGVDDMADIDVHGLTSIRFFDGRQATFRFGSGHAHGAIVLSSQVPAP